MSFNDLSSPATLLATRRSGKPREMVSPGPDDGQLARILAAGMRVPDHGKLAPWRFVVIETRERPAFAAMLRAAYLTEKPDAGRLELETMDQFAHQAPALIAVVSTPIAASKIPVWEQELSAGAACMLIEVAAHAEGFVSGWLTGWPAYSPQVVAALGHPEGRVAGFLFIGSAGRELEERPRPDPAQIVSRWAPSPES